MEGTLATEYPSVLLVSCYVFGLCLEHKICLHILCYMCAGTEIAKIDSRNVK